MIVDASSPGQVDLLRRATLRFAHADQAHGFAAAPGALAFVAVTDDDQVIGWCWGYHLMRPDTSSMVYLHRLEVAEEHRRQGHGRALLGAFVTAGKRSGATKMFLSTAAIADRPNWPTLHPVTRVRG